MPTNTTTTAPYSGSNFASYLTGIPVNQGQNPTLLSMSGTGGILGQMYGQIPGVANPLASAKSAIQGNTGNLESDASLTQGTDILSAEGAQLPFDMNLPGYQSALGTASADTQQELSGQLPQDVQTQLIQDAAERGISTGQGANSPNDNAALLQALGLTSLQEQQQGQSNLSTLIGETPTGASFNPATMFVSPDQEQSAQQAVQQAQAAPDPSASGIFSSIMSLI